MQMDCSCLNCKYDDFYASAEKDEKVNEKMSKELPAEAANSLCVCE